MKLSRSISVIAALLGLLVVLASPAAAHPTGSELREGMRSPDVVNLQSMLDNNVRQDFFDYPTHTGYFGSVTTTGLKAWERATGRTVNGRISVGSHEWNQLAGEARANRSVAPSPSRANIADRSIRLSKSEGMAVDISMEDRKVRLLENGVVTMTLDARFGGRHYNQRTGRMENYPTDKGNFRVFWKHADHYSSLYDNAPMPFSMFYNGGEAIHFSPDFAARGYNGSSHGCTNTRDKAATGRLYHKVSDGGDGRTPTAVTVH